MVVVVANLIVLWKLSKTYVLFIENKQAKKIAKIWKVGVARSLFWKVK